MTVSVQRTALTVGPLPPYEVMMAVLSVTKIERPLEGSSNSASAQRKEKQDRRSRLALKEETTVNKRLKQDYQVQMNIIKATDHQGDRQGLTPKTDAPGMCHVMLVSVTSNANCGFLPCPAYLELSNYF